MARRGDIQGLRAVAVLLVALGHAGVPGLGGGYVGVDVFFVVSGFVITGVLLARAGGDGRVSLVDFYMRRARRILPAAALTLVVTDVAAYYLLNVVRAREAVIDSMWAAAFSANVHFAGEATDYFAQAQPPSPLQHFWSLGVEEQFYVAWPALVALALWRGASARLPLVVVMVAVAAASFAWSAHRVGVEPVGTYFSTFARAWELALGAFLAPVSARFAAVSPVVRSVVGWLGVGGIAAAAATFSASTPVPGPAAVLPAGGAALVVAASVGARQPRLGVGRVLSLAPLRYVGDRSYA